MRNPVSPLAGFFVSHIGLSVSAYNFLRDLLEMEQTTMRGVKKQDLPTKICPVCGRPFTWRKKWEKHWDEVKYCSDACRARKKAGVAHG